MRKMKGAQLTKDRAMLGEIMDEELRTDEEERFWNGRQLAERIANWNRPPGHSLRLTQ